MEKGRWYVGKSPRDREQYAREVIFRLLPPDGGEVRWSALKEGAKGSGISPTTLSAHLERLVGLGIVKRRVDASTRPPSVFYSLAKPLEREGRPLHYATADLPAKLTVVARTGPSAADIYRESIKLNLINLVTMFLLTLYISLGGRGARGSGPEGPAQEGAEGGSSKRRLEKIHGRADELLDGIIRPWIHDLLDALEGLGEEGGVVLEEVTQPLLERASEAMGRIEKALEALRPKESPQNP